MSVSFSIVSFDSLLGRFPRERDVFSTDLHRNVSVVGLPVLIPGSDSNSNRSSGTLSQRSITPTSLDSRTPSPFTETPDSSPVPPELPPFSLPPELLPLPPLPAGSKPPELPPFFQRESQDMDLLAAFKLQLSNGQFEECKKTASQLSNAGFRDAAYNKLSRILLEKQSVNEAQEVARLIQDPIVKGALQETIKYRRLQGADVIPGFEDLQAKLFQDRKFLVDVDALFPAEIVPFREINVLLNKKDWKGAMAAASYIVNEDIRNYALQALVEALLSKYRDKLALELVPKISVADLRDRAYRAISLKQHPVSARETAQNIINGKMRAAVLDSLQNIS